MFPTIKKIEVSNLFDEKNISWDLNARVNVLVGDNGTGKSTLLGIIRELLGHRDQNFLHNTTSAQITFSDDATVSFESNEISYELLKNFLHHLENSHNTDNSPAIENIDAFKALSGLLNKNEANERNVKAILGNVKFSPGANIKDKELIKVEYVSTINMSANSINEIKGSDGETKTVLDMEISREILRLKSYKKKNRDEYESVKKNILSSANSLLKETGKSLFVEDDIIIKTRNKQIKINSLSSGEKQIIYIFLKVANAYFNHAIMLMDEPEISLHLSWQEKLISCIREINPRSQLILVTHSPAIVMKGWMSCFKDMSDIERLI